MRGLGALNISAWIMFSTSKIRRTVHREEWSVMGAMSKISTAPSTSVVTPMTTMVTIVLVIIVTIIWTIAVSSTTTSESSDAICDSTSHVEELIDRVAGMKSIPTATLLIAWRATMIRR